MQRLSSFYKLKVSLKNHQSANVFGILALFDHANISEDLAGTRIHRVENILSVSLFCHRAFDELYMCLKPGEVLLVEFFFSCILISIDRSN